MKRAISYVIIILAVFFTGFFLGSNGPETTMKEIEHSHESRAAEIWTCSMHPQIQMDEPGQCPICGMDLIPAANTSDHNSGKREIKMSPHAVKLAGIRTSEVKRKFVTAKIRLVGKVTYDETAVKDITAWIPGRLDRLFVDYTGITVKKGDHMVSLYSPDLLTAQEELIQAGKSVQEFKNSSMKTLRESAIRTLEASREKLRLWGLTPGQIKDIEKKEKASDHITIYSPISGIVIDKNVDEGAYVNTGTKLYTVADMSKLWVKLDAYESDLLWLRYGQEVELETEAYPGEIFKGTISFIDPVLDSKSRTVKVRVNVKNNDGKLKPGMLIRSVVHSRVAKAGKVMDESLEGKWICPMHPDVIKDSKGVCDICEMPLVTTESLGYAAVEDTEEHTAPLVIPVSAPLVTGKRAVVYVAVPGREGAFEGREIVLGPRAGNYYILKEGLEEGEMVVTNGNFKIDSALQIMAKPSMMNPEGGVAPPDHSQHEGMSHEVAREQPAIKNKQSIEKFDTPDKFQEQVDNVLDVYFAIQVALTKDDPGATKEHGKLFKNALEKVDMTLLGGPAHMEWMKYLNTLNEHSSIIGSVSDIEKQRKSFEFLSEALKTVIKKFGTGGKHAVIVFHCPMAFDNKGADWLQDNPDLQNPYFGDMMLTCGEQKEILVNGTKDY